MNVKIIRKHKNILLAKDFKCTLSDSEIKKSGIVRAFKKSFIHPSLDLVFAKFKRTTKESSLSRLLPSLYINNGNNEDKTYAESFLNKEDIASYFFEIKENERQYKKLLFGDFIIIGMHVANAIFSIPELKDRNLVVYIGGEDYNYYIKHYDYKITFFEERNTEYFASLKDYENSIIITR